MKILSYFKNLKVYQKIVGIIISLFFLIASALYFMTYQNSNIYFFDFSAMTQEMNNGHWSLGTNGISLKKGNYRLYIALYSTSGGTVYGTLEDVSINHSFEPTSNSLEVRTFSDEVNIDFGTDRGQLWIESYDETPISISYISLMSEKPIYNDGLVFGILALLMIPVIWILIYYFNKSSYKNSMLVVIFISLMQLVPFLLKHGVGRGIDSKGHFIRIEGLLYGLLDGQFPVLMQPQMNNSYGMIGALYPNLFLYVPTGLRLLGVSQLGMAKFFLALLIICGGIVAYVSARVMFKKDWQVSLACFCIMMDNMRVTDLMSGGRMGGTSIFSLFCPLLIVGLYEIFEKENSKWSLVGIALAGIACSHVNSASISCIYILLYTLLNLPQLKLKSVRMGIYKAIALFVGLTLGTICNFLTYYFTDWGQDLLQSDLFLESLRSLTNIWDDNKFMSGLLLMIICIVLIIDIWVVDGIDTVKEKVVRGETFKIFVVTSIFMWMTSAYFPWKIFIKIPFVKYYTNMLQYSMRFHYPATYGYIFFMIELLTIIISGRESSPYKNKTLLIVSSIIVVLLFESFGVEVKRFFIDRRENVYHDEVIGAVEYGYEDYLPANTQSEWYCDDSVDISDESALTILSYEQNGSAIDVEYTNSGENVYIEFPKFFYKGYRAKDDLGRELMLQKGNHNRIRVFLDKTDTPKVVNLWYDVPLILTLTNILSFGLWIAVIVVGICRFFQPEDCKQMRQSEQEYC